MTILKAYAKMHCDEKLVLVGKGSEEDSVDYIMAVPASENHLLGIISVLIEKTIGKGRIFSGTYYILLGALIARTRISYSFNEKINLLIAGKRSIIKLVYYEL